MRSPRHLWTGEWRAESDQARDDGASALRRTVPPRATGPQEPATPPPPPRGSNRRATFLLGGLVVLLAIVAGALAATMLLDDGDGGGPDPLPAVASKPVRPRPGQTRAGAIYAAASPAVVSIRTTTGSGTGFLVERQGMIVTNAHVVSGASHVIVKFGTDGASIDGDVLGVDASSDLAVVSIDPSRVPNGVRPLRFADSRDVSVGDFAIAIGNPFGLDRTATEGIVSGLGRSITSPNGFEIDQVIQTDAPINPGNSGGPLLDDGGKVIGVNSQIISGGGGLGSQGGNVGIGFAVPSNTVREIVPRLEKGQSVPHPYLGVRTTVTSLTNPDGARVAGVEAGTPAARAGVQVGDVIRRSDGDPVHAPEDVAASIADRKPGDRIELEVDRGGRALTLHVTLGDRPNRAP